MASAAPNALANPLQGRMRRLLADLGDPQTSWPAAHVAGTKGKGSTTAMLASILQQAGYRAGAYTRCAALHTPGALP
jgi:folylpolyglutamate synthase/dihydropteroate synthase